MEKDIDPTREYLNILGFILGWFGLFLLLMAILFSAHIDFGLALLTFFGLWFMLIIVFALIFMINIISVLYIKFQQRFGNKISLKNKYTFFVNFS